MTLEQISIHELLLDQQYRKYFMTVPKLPAHYTEENQPWKLMVLVKGETQWRTKRFGKYSEAFTKFKEMRPKVSDAAIVCLPVGFRPPFKTYRIKGKFDQYKRPVLRSKLWTPQIDADMADHYWCPYCRRPTVWKIMAVNLNRPGTTYRMPVAEPVMRCSICGVSERVVDLRRPENHQGWDTSREKFYL